MALVSAIVLLFPSRLIATLSLPSVEALQFLVVLTFAVLVRAHLLLVIEVAAGVEGIKGRVRGSASRSAAAERTNDPSSIATMMRI